MTKRKLNKQDTLELVNQIEELSKPTRRDEEHASIAHYVNLLLAKFGREGARLVGSTSERMRVRTEENEADSDFILICGKSEIPAKCLEYNKECPCFVHIKGNDLLQTFKVDLVDGKYFPADLIRNVDPEAFSLLRIIHKALTKTLHSMGRKTPRDMIRRTTKVGVEVKQYLGTVFEFVDKCPKSSTTTAEVVSKEGAKNHRSVAKISIQCSDLQTKEGSIGGSSEKATIRYRSFTGKDYVPCFRLSGLPIGISDWGCRKRLWPSKDVVNAIINGEFFLVAKPALVIPRPEIDFCLAFSSAEKKLFDEVFKIPMQRKCYLAIKAMHRAELKHLNILKTFHWKSAFFWISEKCTSWSENTFLAMVRKILKFMERSLEKRELPHYFVQSNLFADLKTSMKDADVSQNIKKLKEIQSDPTAALQKFINLAETGEYDLISVEDALLAKRAKRIKGGKVGVQHIKDILLDAWKELSELKRFSKETYNDNSLYSIKNILKAVVDVAQQVVDDGYNRNYFLTQLENPLISDKELGQISVAIKALRVVLFFVCLFTRRWFILACATMLLYLGFPSLF